MLQQIPLAGASLPLVIINAWKENSEPFAESRAVLLP
jgi:hypothetical protein